MNIFLLVLAIFAITVFVLSVIVLLDFFFGPFFCKKEKKEKKEPEMTVVKEDLRVLGTTIKPSDEPDFSNSFRKW